MFRGDVRRREEAPHEGDRHGEDRHGEDRRAPGREDVRPGEDRRRDNPGDARGDDPSREGILSCRSEWDSGSRDDRPRRGCRNGASSRGAIFYATPDTRGNRPIRDRSIWNGTSVRRDVSTTIRFGKIFRPERRGQRTRPFRAE